MVALIHSTMLYYKRYDVMVYIHSIAPCNKSEGGVLWTVSYIGTFYTTMDFRAFPFDKYACRQRCCKQQLRITDAYHTCTRALSFTGST